MQSIKCYHLKTNDLNFLEILMRLRRMGTRNSKRANVFYYFCQPSMDEVS